MPKRNRVFRGDRLRMLRGQMTQDAFATIIGIEQPQLNKYEKGRQEPTTDIVVRMAEKLEVTADYLLGLVDNPDERLTESQLTEEEWELLQAFRRGDLKGIVKIATRDTAPSEH